MDETLDRPARCPRDIAIDRDDLRVRITVLIELEVADHALVGDRRIDSRRPNALPKVHEIGGVAGPRDRVEDYRGTACAVALYVPGATPKAAW